MRPGLSFSLHHEAKRNLSIALGQLLRLLSLIHLLSTSFFQFINLYTTSFVSHSFNSLTTLLKPTFHLLIYITIAGTKRSLLSDDVIATDHKKLKKSKSTSGLTNIVNLVGLPCVLRWSGFVVLIFDSLAF